jgi:methyltransferase (TIGR00027 family)
MISTSTLSRSVKLPDYSCMLKVGQLRHIQSVRESGDYWNPDVLVSRLLSPVQRWSCFWRGRLLLARLRSDPFYYYVVARTKYYDSVFVDALCDNVQRIVNVGCGSDTRAYRYAQLLSQRGVIVLECDQAGAIEAKEKIASERLPAAPVQYLSIDLNEGVWPCLESWFDQNRGSKMLVLMEGVTPYINEESFGAFLHMLACRLPAGSRVAYDYKIRGTSDEFGLSGRTQRPFRLSSGEGDVAAYHLTKGFRVRHVETSADLSRRVLPALAELGPRRVFRNDCLVQLELPGSVACHR